jgi:hypothetical protein
MIFLKVMLIIAVPLLLEAAAIFIIFSKYKANKQFLENSEEMDAVVTHKDSQKMRMTNARYTLYVFTVNADNGRTYDISATGVKASKINIGDTVRIRVPEGAPEAVVTNERFDYIIQNAEEMLPTLTKEEKTALNEYIDKRAKSVWSNMTYSEYADKRVVLASEGSGLMSEMILFTVLAVLALGFIAYAIYFSVTEVMI